MTREQAIERAHRLAKKNRETYFVVLEAGEIDVCSESDLDWYYQGISDQNVLHCTEDWS
jgi:non-canonical (house-cleaning) NTP pyrophosphatase